MHLQKYILRRTLEIVVTLFIIITLLFILFRLAPGDPTSMIIDPDMTPEDIEHFRDAFGLNDSLSVQYFKYLTNIIKGEFGNSFHYDEPVLGIIKEKLLNTILLFTTATLLAAFAGISWGKYLAWRRGTFTEATITFAGLLLHTIFVPWFALLAIWIFGFKLGWFPLNGMMTPEIWLNPDSGIFYKALDVIHHMMLPLFVLFTVDFSRSMLVMKSSMLDTLREDYIVTAKAKGLKDRIIRNKHAAKNAMLPVVTSVSLSIAFSINGSALTETVFSWPGLGRELVFAVSNNDYPLAQASFLLISGLVLVANLVSDILYAYLDPRIKY